MLRLHSRTLIAGLGFFGFVQQFQGYILCVGPDLTHSFCNCRSQLFGNWMNFPRLLSPQKFSAQIGNAVLHGCSLKQTVAIPTNTGQYGDFLKVRFAVS